MKLKGQIKFVNTDRNQFYQVLKKRVDQYFADRGLSKYANRQMIVKSVILLAGYLLPFIAILFVPMPLPFQLLMWLMMGVNLAGIGMSVMHDANHGSYSGNKAVNYFMGSMLNLLGGSVFNWKLQHNILHHTYTNIAHMDEDIEDRLVLKFSPHSPHKKVHRFQHIYAFAFYGLLTLYWVVAKDFIQFFKYIRNGVNNQSARDNRLTLMKIFVLKALYFGVMLVLPVLSGLPFLHILVGFIVMHFVGGIILTTVFQLAHTVEGTAHPLPNTSGNIENDWAIHQLQTTVNFARHSRWLSWYVGGLNFQIEHHLFPRISHVHYPAISPIVQQTASEFGLEYRVNATFMTALRSHVEALKTFGLPRAEEAIG